MRIGMKRAHRTHGWIRKRLCAWMLIAVALAAPALAAGAIDTSEAASLTILFQADGTAVTGAEFGLYRVADISAEAEFTLTGGFEEYAGQIKLDNLSGEDWRTLAQTLQGYAAADASLTPVREGAIGTDGTLTFEELETGLYLLLGKEAVAEGRRYAPEAALLSLPSRDVDGGWNYHLTASVKYACLGDEPTTMMVQKAWKGDSESDRPVQIMVQLLRDGMVRDTVMLTAGNGWAYTWENLEPGAWQVIESPVPDGYQLERVEYSGELATIVNVKSGTPSTGGDEKLPQTGLLWWPVPLLALAGMALFAIGWMRSKQSEER